MSLRERWNELETGGKILVGFGVGIAVLLIAIPVIVILAAVVGSFVLAAGEPSAAPATPQASFSFDLDAEESMVLTITHDGGDTLQADRLTVEAGDRTVGWEGAESVSAGDSTTVETNPGERVTLVWQGEEESAILTQYETPDS